MDKRETKLRTLLNVPRVRRALFGVGGLTSVSLLLISLVTSVAPVQAATLNTLNFQARLQSNPGGGIVPDGTYNLEFKLYNDDTSAGSSQGSCAGDTKCLWTETYTGADRVRVANGYLSVHLGSETSFPTTINWDQDLWLTINVGGTGTPGWNGEMSPRLKLGAVPYAFKANQLATFNGTTGFTSTLQLLQPTVGNQVFQIQDQGAAGTYNLCVQGSNSCGFASASGSGSYIQNTASLQTNSNFALQSASDASITGYFEGRTNQSAAVVQVKGGSAQSGDYLRLVDSSNNRIFSVDSLGAVNIDQYLGIGIGSSAGVQLRISPTVSSNVSLHILGSSTASSTNILQIDANNSGAITYNGAGTFTATTGTSQTAASANYRLSNTSGTQTDGLLIDRNGVGGTTTNGITVQQTAGTLTNGLAFAGAIGTDINRASGTLTLNGAGGINLKTNGTTSASLSSAGAALFKNVSDSASAFQVQNAANNQVLTVDTSANRVIFGKAGASGVTGVLVLQNAANGNTVTIQSGTTAGSYALTLPTTGPSLGDCLQNDGTTVGQLTFAACNGGGGGGITTVGTFSGTSQTNGANITGSTITFGPADTNNPGMISTGTQTIAGDKTLSGNTTLGGTLNQASNTTADLHTVASTNTSGTQLNGVLYNRNGSGGTTTNGINVQNTAGTLTNGLSFTGTIATDINRSSGTLSLNGAGGINLQTNGTTTASLSSTGQALFKNTSNSNTAFRIQDANSVNYLQADTSAGTLAIDSVLTVSGITSAASAGALGAFATNANTLPAVRAYASTAASNGYIYAIGGYDGSAISWTSVYYAKVNADGSTGSWSTNANVLPAARSQGASVVANGYIYVVGGGQTPYYAKLNSDGSTGSWLSGTNLPAFRGGSTAVAANGYIYVIAGADSTNPVSTVYYARLGADGSIGSWTTSANPLTNPRWKSSTVVANGYVYVMGGYDGAASPVRQSTIYYAKLNADGSTSGWTTNTSNPLPTALAEHTSVVANGYVYVMGGSITAGSAPQTAVYYAKLNNNGSIGTWMTNSNSMPAARNGHVSVTVNGYVYAIGGAGSSIAHNTVYYASTARLQVAASLDLIGPTGGVLGDVSGDIGGGGSVGGSIAAGNIFSNGSLSVVGNTQLTGGLGVTGSLSLAGGNAIISGGSLCVKSSTSTACSGSTAGTIYANAALNTAADYAENYISSHNLPKGTVVSLAQDGNNAAVVATGSTRQAVLGIVSTEPGVTLNADVAPDAGHPYVLPIALAGRVPVRVSDANGVIQAGDYLAASLTDPGVAVKAVGYGQTIGTALDDDNGSGKVTAFVNLSWNDTNSASSWQGGYANLQNQINQLGVSINTGSLNTSALTVTGNATISGNLTVGGALHVSMLRLSGHVLTSGAAPQTTLLAAAGPTGATVSVEGNDITGTITVKAGNQAQAGNLVKLTFANAYADKPQIVLTEVGQASAQLQAYVDSPSHNNFELGVLGQPQPGAIYKFTYHVLQ